jgi:hypothetical protein
MLLSQTPTWCECIESPNVSRALYFVLWMISKLYSTVNVSEASRGA